MTPQQRLIGQKCARRSENSDQPPTKKLNNLQISAESNEQPSSSKTKRTSWSSKQSNADAINLNDFEYIWRTKDVDHGSSEMTGCKCTKDQCDRDFCVCSAGNVRLDNEYNIKNPIRLSRHFYESNYSECTIKCECKGKCNRRIRTAKSVYELIARKTTNRGFGVFTGSDIPAGAFVCELTGKFISYKEWRNTAPDSFVFCFELKNRWTNGFANVKEFFTCIDARKCGNESRYINHSCDPNLIFLQSRNHYADHQPTRILLIAKRKIVAGEELTYYYGRRWMEYQKEESRGFKCLCNSRHCFMSKTGELACISFNSPQLLPAFEEDHDEDHEEEQTA
ncbi:hypothetical protein M3Y97_00121900 [Aphelenchoides bicaudatus]|nr:hypothetical protein M3Y97_00121900 [Aphelenchoides bicaudatus]